ncbi:MAG: CRTAC1 family protein [Planctomycetota bacterium]
MPDANVTKALLSAAAAGLAAAGTASAQTVQYTERAGDAGLIVRYIQPPGDATYNPMTGGAVAGDFNNDGWCDLFVLSGGGDGPDRLFINDANAGPVTFTERGAEYGVDAWHIGSGASVYDYDGDGWLDIYVTSMGPITGFERHAHRLYRNTGAEGVFGFKQVASIAGVATTGEFEGDGYGASWGDYDLDGDADLAVAGWTQGNFGNRLFTNNGDGTFADSTGALQHPTFDFRGFSPRFADMDGDFYPELLWTADFGTSHYFINNTDGTFTEATAASGTGLDTNGMGSFVADINNDGMPDWYVTSIDDPIKRRTGNMAYVNAGAHTFDERAVELGVMAGYWGWGVAGHDFDNDTDIDIAETNGWILHPNLVDPSILWMQTDPLKFTDQAAISGFNHFGQGRGLLCFDPDNDGDLDIVVTTNDDRLFYFESDAADRGNHWLKLQLETSASANLAPLGLGAHVVATITIEGESVELHRWMQSGPNYLTADEPGIHLGLGNAPTIDRLEIRWPNGTTRVLEDVPSDQALVLASCPGDFTGDHALDIFDVLAYLDRFDAGDRAADLDVNGQTDVFDVLAYLEAFQDGCPSDG